MPSTAVSAPANRIYGTAPTGPDVTSIVATPGQPVGTFGLVRSGQDLLYPVILAKPSAGGAPNDLGPQNVPITATALYTLPSDRKPRTVNLGPTLGDYRVAAASLANGDSVIIGLPLNDVNATVSQLDVRHRPGDAVAG